MTALVEVTDLVRTFQVRPRRRGVVGALRDLVSGRSVEVAALSGVSLTVGAGEIVGYIGPNGAGKSTTIKCVTGILKPTSGTVRVCGLDPWKERSAHVRNIGVVFGQRTQLWWDLAVVEALDLLAAVFEVPPDLYRSRLGALQELLDLQPLLRTPVRELSLGQRVRCDLAAALLHAPRVVLLDEPTIGLDVAVKHKIRAFVRDLAARDGVAVLLTTHDLGDVESLCHRVVLVDRGAAVFEGTLDALRARLGGRRRLVVTTRGPIPAVARDQLAARLGVVVGELAPDRVEITFAAGQSASPIVAAALEVLGATVDDLSLAEPSIEEVVAAFYAEQRS